MTSDGIKILSLLAVKVIMLHKDCVVRQDISDQSYMEGQNVDGSPPTERVMLFHLSVSNGFSAYFSLGEQREPIFMKHVSRINRRAPVSDFMAEVSQLMTYWAPENKNKQRGKIAFFRRLGYPGRYTSYPIFRVSYADHTCCEMVWLRIYINVSGFEVFMTCLVLSHHRNSYFPERLPGQVKRIYFSLSWDITTGIIFNKNRRPIASKSSGRTLFDAEPGQFGSRSMIISPYKLHRAYNFMRGGDFYRMNGDEKYLDRGPDNGTQKRILDKHPIEEIYRNEITNLAINTGEVRRLTHNIGLTYAPGTLINVRKTREVLAGLSVIPSLEAHPDGLNCIMEVSVKFLTRIDVGRGSAILIV